MDTLRELNRKHETLQGDAAFLGLDAVIEHIKMGERHLDRSRKENDERLCNDVIYRTNQAFEGSLKEAYSRLTGNDPAKKTSNQIESYFQKNEVLRPRVLDLFTNYRIEWRNQSTHDHTLTFSDSEAFIAIINISAFAAVLMDQIIELAADEKEREAVDKRRAKIEQNLGDEQPQGIFARLLSILQAFNNELNTQQIDNDLSETQLIGRLNGFISELMKGLTIEREARLAKGSSYRADFIIRSKNESVLIELKRPGLNQHRFPEAKHQLARYLEVADVDAAILFVPATTGEVRVSKQIYRRTGKGPLPVGLVVPAIWNDETDRNSK